MNHLGGHRDIARRRLLAMTPAALSVAPNIASAAQPRRPLDEYDDANTRIGHVVSANLSDDGLLFLQQIGMRSVIVNFSAGSAGNAVENLDDMRRVQERFASFGLRIFGGLNYAYRSLKIQLGQAGRDEDIARYQTFLRNAGKLGIRVAPYDFHPANTYTTAMVKVSAGAFGRGYMAREFSVDDFRQKVEKQRFDHEYSADDIWDYYTYFMKAVLPVAAESNVTLALHPDDPPLAKMNGVAKLFVHVDGYKRAEQIAKSITRDGRGWGLTLCVGTWSEGGDRMGKDSFEMIRDFGGRQRIRVIHFRNVSSPLPRFHETFPDDGYLDMARVMRTLREVRFDGCAIPDHIPQLIGDTGQRAGLAYCVAYMRALLRRANEEVG